MPKNITKISEYKLDSGGGMGLVVVLTIVFIVLKLTHLINWPWIWVLSPIWISGLLMVLVLLATLIGFLIFKKRG